MTKLKKKSLFNSAFLYVGRSTLQVNNMSQATAKIIPIAQQQPNSTQAVGQEFIERAYELLNTKAGLTIRPGQISLSKDIYNSITKGLPIAAEAPTGTGKTLAYLVAALAAAKFLSPEGRLPVVVSTATNGLQQQILLGDIPKLIEGGLIAPGDALIAKGRGRYFCVAQAEEYVSEDPSTQFDLFDADANEIKKAAEVVEAMLEHFHADAWDGDIDSWKGSPTKAWDAVKANADTCTNKRCEYFAQCPFFKERMKLAESSVIVANHDLVLSDLSLQKSDKEPLFPSTRYISVFDEAHHLPDKAIEAGSSEINFEEIKVSLNNVNLFAKSLLKAPDLAKFLASKQIFDKDLDATDTIAAAENLANLLRLVEVDSESKMHRFQAGSLSKDVIDATIDLKTRLNHTYDILNEAAQKMKTSKQLADSPLTGPKLAEIILRCSKICNNLKQAIRWARDFSSELRMVRWVYRSDLYFKAYCAPLEGKDVLNELLWDNARVLPVLISATLRDFGGFDRFIAKSGLPEKAQTAVLQPIFPYEKCQLIFADMKASPKMDSREAFIKELSKRLPMFVLPKTGTLILFPSKTLMMATIGPLKAKFKAAVLVQGDKPFKNLITEHKENVDKGKASIICGLATMAEGLDLPGNYCTNVLITGLPFSVPSHPVEQELQEELGTKYFEQRALPDALTRLIQMVGRLMRRETDRGRIVVFDNRLAKTRYGQKMIGALPPFSKRFEATGDAVVVNLDAARNLEPVQD